MSNPAQKAVYIHTVLQDVAGKNPVRVYAYKEKFHTWARGEICQSRLYFDGHCRYAINCNVQIFFARL
jgi:hypothetical protein